MDLRTFFFSDVIFDAIYFSLSTGLALSYRFWQVEFLFSFSSRKVLIFFLTSFKSVFVLIFCLLLLLLVSPVCLWYQAPPGELGMYPLWIRGATVFWKILFHCLLTYVVFDETSTIILTCSFLFMYFFSLRRLSEFSFFISSQQVDYDMSKYDFFSFFLYPSALFPVLLLSFLPSLPFLPFIPFLYFSCLVVSEHGICVLL